MHHTTLRLLILPLILGLGLVLVAACEESDAPAVNTRDSDLRRDVRGTLEELRTELGQDITPERKEQLIGRCANAFERLRANNDPQADRLAGFCDSLETTNPNSPAAWNDIKTRLNELIRRLMADRGPGTAQPSPLQEV